MRPISDLQCAHKGRALTLWGLSLNGRGQALRSPHTQVLCNITSIMFWVAYGNAENQRALIDLPQFLPSMASIIRPNPGEQVPTSPLLSAVSTPPPPPPPPPPPFPPSKKIFSCP